MRERDDGRPETIEQLHAWYDQHYVDDIVLYDITAQTATSLAALIIGRRCRAADEADRTRWDAELRRVDQEKATLDPEDRAALIAQQHAWLQQARMLDRERRAS